VEDREPGAELLYNLLEKKISGTGRQRLALEIRSTFRHPYRSRKNKKRSRNCPESMNRPQGAEKLRLEVARGWGGKENSQISAKQTTTDIEKGRL